MTKISEFYAYVYWDEAEGQELVLGWPIGAGGSPWPMVGPDRERLEAMKPIARSISHRSDVPVKFVKFSGREELEVINSETN